MLVVAAVIERAGRVLVCQRPAHKHHGGLWEFPGGKVEPGESLAQALARELHEELALTSAHLQRELHRYHADNGVELVFLLTEAAGEPRCLEHQALAWIDPLAPLDLPLAPGDLAFLQAWRASLSPPP